MPGPVSESRRGPRDRIPFGPRWAYPHLTKENYEKLKRLHDEAQKQHKAGSDGHTSKADAKTCRSA